MIDNRLIDQKSITVERRNLNVRISALLDIVRLLNRSDFERRLKTGHFRPDFRRSVPIINNIKPNYLALNVRH